MPFKFTLRKTETRKFILFESFSRKNFATRGNRPLTFGWFCWKIRHLPVRPTHWRFFFWKSQALDFSHGNEIPWNLFINFASVSDRCQLLQQKENMPKFQVFFVFISLLHIHPRLLFILSFNPWFFVCLFTRENTLEKHNQFEKKVNVLTVCWNLNT